MKLKINLKYKTINYIYHSMKIGDLKVDPRPINRINGVNQILVFTTETGYDNISISYHFTESLNLILRDQFSIHFCRCTEGRELIS